MAAEVFFSTNESDWTKLEGLYVSERKPPGFVKGRDLGVVAFAGKTVRGPTTAQEITSPGRFLEIYGGRDYGAGGTAINEIWKALVNKKFSKIVVRRVHAAAAVKGTATFSTFVRIDAASAGVWSLAANGGPTVSIEDASDADATHFNLRIRYQGKEYLYRNLNTSVGSDNLTSVIGTDLANLVTATKLLDGRPANVQNTALAGGTDGSIAASDYISGITDIANFQGVSVCLIPETPVNVAGQTTLNGTIVTLASTIKDRVFLTWAGEHLSPAADKTRQVAEMTTRSDRIWWLYNVTETMDPETGANFDQGPHVWMASVIANTDVDIHPGAYENMPLLAGISKLKNEALTRDDLILLRDTGISALEKLPDGFQFRSGVTTDLTSGKTEITRRRMADFLQLSGADALKWFVKSRNNKVNRAIEAGLLISWLKGLQTAGRVVDEDTEDAGPGFQVDQASVNTTAQRAQGLEKILMRVRLVGHQLHLVLETELGTGVVIEA